MVKRIAGLGGRIGSEIGLKTRLCLGTALMLGAPGLSAPAQAAC